MQFNWLAVAMDCSNSAPTGDDCGSVFITLWMGKSLINSSPQLNISQWQFKLVNC